MQTKDHIDDKPILSITEISHITAGNVKEVKRILRKHNISELQEYTFTGFGLLHFVASGQHCETIKLLLDAGYDPDVPCLQGYTPLHASVLRHNYESINSLISGNADLNTVEYKVGMSALHSAVTENDIKSIEILLQHGADINITDKQGYTPLHYAIKNMDKTGAAKRAVTMLINADARLDIAGGPNNLKATDMLKNRRLTIEQLIKPEKDVTVTPLKLH